MFQNVIRKCKTGHFILHMSMLRLDKPVNLKTDIYYPLTSIIEHFPDNKYLLGDIYYPLTAITGL